MTNLNPFTAVGTAFREAWREVEDEFRTDVPEDKPPEVLRAQESANALRTLRASFGQISQERRRLKDRGQ